MSQTEIRRWERKSLRDVETDTSAFLSSSPAPEPREEDGQPGHSSACNSQRGTQGLPSLGDVHSAPEPPGPSSTRVASEP